MKERRWVVACETLCGLGFESGDRGVYFYESYSDAVDSCIDYAECKLEQARRELEKELYEDALSRLDDCADYFPLEVAVSTVTSTFQLADRHREVYDFYGEELTAAPIGAA